MPVTFLTAMDHQHEWVRIELTEVRVIGGKAGEVCVNPPAKVRF
jgi:hypothetical protein